jgi:hypothetical protein
VPRYFTLEQAQAAIPRVEAALRDALAVKASLTEDENELRAEAERVRLAGGAQVDRRKIAAALERRETAAGRLRAALEGIEQHGCIVKDLDIGLLDFPTLYRGEEVYLCWKLGEPSIGFWHGVDEGYRGRKAIGREFLEHHRGGE